MAPETGGRLMDDRERRETDPAAGVPGDPVDRRPVDPAGGVPADPVDRRPGDPQGMRSNERNVVVDNRGPGALVWVLIIAVVVLAILWLTGVIGGGTTTPADEGPVVPVEDQLPPADAQDEAQDNAPGAMDLDEQDGLLDQTDALDPPLAPEDTGEDLFEGDN